jgi:DNA-binding beta-propeller fold protein YncE
MRDIRLSILPLLSVLLVSSATSQNPTAPPSLSPEQKADSEALRALANSVPLLPVERIELKVNPPMTLEGYSAAGADKRGNIYVIHRPADPNVDPVVVLDSKGNFLRSWGKGMYTMPHSIRIDPTGNVWTVDARTSMIFKFTPEGKKLLEISVGDIPDASQAFCGATDVAFAENGHIYVSDGYCNARFLEYSASGKKLHEWGKIATVPLKTFRARPNKTGRGEFNLAHDISVDSDGILYVADRENGRLQWFDKDGKYLGEKKFGGQLFSVAHSPSGDLYVGTHPRDAATFVDDSFIFKFDPVSGKILGKIEAPAHQLSVAPDGTLLPGIRAPTTNSVLLLRPLK